MTRALHIAGRLALAIGIEVGTLTGAVLWALHRDAAAEAAQRRELGYDARGLRIREDDDA